MNLRYKMPNTAWRPRPNRPYLKGHHETLDNLSYEAVEKLYYC